MLRKTSKALGKIQQVEQKLNYFKSYQPSSLLNNPVLFENKKNNSLSGILFGVRMEFFKRY